MWQKRKLLQLVRHSTFLSLDLLHKCTCARDRLSCTFPGGFVPATFNDSKQNVVNATMLVSYPNDVKVYNLSVGKSLPEWLSDRKKRKLQKNDDDVRRRIELIQDFQMPDVSNCVRLTNDGQFILATGTYKPRIRCYDVHNLSMKFERCLDAEVIKMIVLSESWEKLVFLEEDRWLEFHVQYGKYFRIRIPKFGRDMVYHSPNCDLFIVGSGPDIYRLNLEQGRFLAPYETCSSSLTACAVNPEHYLVVCGSEDGKVEAWDPRTRRRVSTVDVAASIVLDSAANSTLPAVSTLRFKDALHLAVGTSEGQILVYDIRSSKPLHVKDHHNGLPIKSVEFVGRAAERDLVMSMDARAVKIWHEADGRPYTTVEPTETTGLNDLCVVPNTGLFLVANEAQKILTYYVPAVGPAPRWCAFLDNITEELEETETSTLYDDYKFVTHAELEDLGLVHLVGSALLRAYMHGYFIDIRLYNKAKALSNPFAYDEYRKAKIREKIDEQRASRVRTFDEQKLPKVNRELAERILLEKDDVASKPSSKVSRKKASTVAASASLLDDARFKALFEDPAFEVDASADEFRLINPALAKLERSKKKQAEELRERRDAEKEAREAEDDEEVQEKDWHKDFDDEGESSSESERDEEFERDVKRAHRELATERRLRERVGGDGGQFRAYKLKEGENERGDPSMRDAAKTQSLAERLAAEVPAPQSAARSGAVGAREITFTIEKKARRGGRRADEVERKQREHVQERRAVRRSAAEISATIKAKPKFWRGKRVA